VKRKRRLPGWTRQGRGELGPCACAEGEEERGESRGDELGLEGISHEPSPLICTLFSSLSALLYLTLLSSLNHSLWFKIHRAANTTTQVTWFPSLSSLYSLFLPTLPLTE
jgi:hypothetical protein